jgi:hypothetical protein
MISKFEQEQKKKTRIRHKDVNLYTQDLYYWFTIMKDEKYKDKEEINILIKQFKKLHEQQLEFLRGKMKDFTFSKGKIAILDEDILKTEEMMRILVNHRK